MKINVEGKSESIRLISIFKLSDISIFVQVDTKIKWPGVSFGSSYKAGISSQNIIIHESEASGVWLCTVKLSPETEWDKELLNNCASGMVSSRYGPAVIYTLIPREPEMIAQWEAPDVG